MNVDQAVFGPKLIKIAAGAILGVAVVALIWPFNSVPTGSRGVVTQFGKMVGIEPEGLAVLPPWRKLSNFSVRADSVPERDEIGMTN
jgi:regulator of protease activity HflC (stomatin/prohibitin superfamily)